MTEGRGEESREAKGGEQEEVRVAGEREGEEKEEGNHPWVE